MSRHNDRRHDQDDDFSPRPQRPPQRRARRWPWLVLMLLVFILLLPNALTLMGLEQTLIKQFTGDLNGELKVGRVSAGWFQPVVLKNVSLLDADQQPVISIAEVKSSKRLWSFVASVFQSPDYGHFELTQPVISLRLRHGGSNLEDVLANYLNTETGQEGSGEERLSSSVIPQVSVRIVDGAASITSVTNPDAWSVDQIAADAQLGSQNGGAVARVRCRVTPFQIDAGGTPIPQGAGNLDLLATFDSGQRELLMKSVDVTLQSESVPLSIIGPLAERVVGPTRVAGGLDCKLKVAFDIPSARAQATVESMRLSDFQIASQELLGPDVFQLTSASASGQINVSPENLEANQFRLQSPIGRVEANGQFEFATVNRLAQGGFGQGGSAPGQGLPVSNFQMHGNLDLAGLIRMLPTTFHTHQDLQLQSGVANFQISSKQQALLMNVDMANLKARRGGRDVLWQAPIQLSGVLSSAAHGLKLKDLNCRSDFFSVVGNAQLSEAVFDFRGDLDGLTERVGQFVDLEQMAFGGQLTGKFGWRLRDLNPGAANSAGANPAVANSVGNQNAGLVDRLVYDRPIDMIGSFVVTKPRVTMPGLSDWTQEQATIQMEAVFQALSSGEIRVDSATGYVNLGREQATIALLKPIANVLADPEQWQFQGQLVGDASGYLRHVKNFVDLGPIQASGNLEVTTGVAIDGSSLVFSSLNYVVQQPQFNGYGLVISEPQVNGAGNMRYDLETGVIAISDTTFSSTAVSARGQNVQVIVADNVQVNGVVELRADVSRVADWLQLSPTDDSVFLFGDAQGTVQLASDASGIGAVVDIKIKDLTAATKGPKRLSGAGGSPSSVTQLVSQRSNMTPVWTEKQVVVGGGMKLSNDFDTLALNQMQVTSDTLAANASGVIGELSDRMVTDLNGIWSPNWDLVNALLDVYTGRTVRLHGTGEQPFIVRGPIFETVTGSDYVAETAPLISPRLQASTRVGWSGGQVLDLAVGAGMTEVIVDQAVVSAEVKPTEFSGGRFQMSPKIDLRSGQPVLYLERQRLLDQAQLTPQTCASVLKFINPLAAGATSAEGVFSIDSDGLQVPLYDATKMRGRASVTLQNVVVSAGPMAEQLIGAAKQIQALVRPDKVDSQRDYNTWLRMSEQTVPVSVENGRVYHEGIRFSHDGVEIETTGSVGMDQTVDMMARIPIPDQWLEKSKYLEGLRGQALSIPITGTISKPIIDRRAINNYSAQLARSAANSALNKVVTDKLNPKLNQYQNELSEKFGGEISKVQNKLQSELQDQLQQNLGNQLQEGLGGALRQQLQGRLGGVLGGVPQTAPQRAPGLPNPAGRGPGVPVQQNIEQDLIRGIGNLFNRQ